LKVDLFKINQQTCNKDGICSAVCPVGLIDFEKGSFPTPAADAEDICVRCGHCVAACPTGSFFHRDVSADPLMPAWKDFPFTAENCELFLRSRRSIRTYKKKPVPRKDLTRLIEIARCAPSGHNSQCTEWLVLGNRDELHKLAAITVDWMRWTIRNMPEFALSMHMDRVVKRWEEGNDVILRNAPVVIVAHAEKDNRLAPAACTIALAYLELAATGMGLGCCWAGYFNAAATVFPSMTEALKLPAGHQCFGSMMTGYPKFSYYRLPVRKPPHISWRLS
jgi:nitroreductase/NAD-dependent dihydropyrimidine dehydrogenase PreA subunit